MDNTPTSRNSLPGQWIDPWKTPFYPKDRLEIQIIATFKGNLKRNGE